MNLGWTEIIMIAGIALLLFGPSKLPNLGRSLGESIRGFKKALNEDEPTNDRDVTQITQNQQKPMNQQAAPQEVKKNETHES